MRYAQLVIGLAGSGKVSFFFIQNHLCISLFIFNTRMQVEVYVFVEQSTYCSSLNQHCETIRRTMHIVNLDPAAEVFNYPVAMGENLYFFNVPVFRFFFFNLVTQ